MTVRSDAPDAHGFEIDERLITVVPLIADHFFEAIAVGSHYLNLFGGFDQRLNASLGVPASASCTVTPTIAPVSRSTACSAL